MEYTFLTAIDIRKVRHLHDVYIPVSKAERKNLILTGKNGSGKTSVLEYLTEHLEYVVSKDFKIQEEIQNSLMFWVKQLEKSDDTEAGRRKKEEAKRSIALYEEKMRYWTTGCIAEYTSISKLREKYQNGQFILAMYSDERRMELTEYENIEKVSLKPVYGIHEKPSRDLGRYLANLKSIQAFAQTEGNFERAQQIKEWFVRFENILKRVYQNDSLRLDFDIETFQFSVLLEGREPFKFNAMSMGYAAVFDIIGDLMMRMESQRRYDMEGIVLIDEIETHLHVELQKEIMPILTELFPNIQFVLTTHSPFILNSAKDSVVFDLEKELLVEEGLTGLPYEGIVEGYFKVDLLSQELRENFEEYKRLVKKQNLRDIDYARIVELEDRLDEVPDYLALDFAEEYNRLKSEFSN